MTTEQTIVTSALGAAVVATLSGLAVLIAQWRRGRLIIDARQLAVRLAGGLVLLVIFVLLGFLGVYLPARPELAQRAFWPAFWATGLLACSLVGFVLLDLRLLLANQLRHEMRFGAEMAELWKQRPDDR